MAHAAPDACALLIAADLSAYEKDTERIVRYRVWLHATQLLTIRRVIDNLDQKPDRAERDSEPHRTGHCLQRQPFQVGKPVGCRAAWRGIDHLGQQRASSVARLLPRRGNPQLVRAHGVPGPGQGAAVMLVGTRGEAALVPASSRYTPRGRSSGFRSDPKQRTIGSACGLVCSSPSCSSKISVPEDLARDAMEGLARRDTELQSERSRHQSPRHCNR